jgi:opacity protein-like surface antigen
MIKRILLFIPFTLVPFTAHAYPSLDLYLTGGAAFTHLSNNSTVQMNDFLVNNYFTRTQSKTGPLLGLGIGHTFTPIAQPLSIALNLAGYYTDYATVEGTEYPFANDGIYDSLNYKFRAQSYAAMVESRFIYTSYEWQPYVLAGIGCSWNRLYGYSETPSINSLTAATAQDTFTGNTLAAFAYEAGIGVQRVLYNDNTHNIQYSAAVDYRYFNYGKGELGTAPSQTTNNKLKVSTLYNQAVALTFKATI